MGTVLAQPVGEQETADQRLPIREFPAGGVSHAERQPVAFGGRDEPQMQQQFPLLTL